MPSNSLIELKKDLIKLANPEQAKNLQRFFKTGPGEYGEGDIFLGLKVPDQRKLAKRYQHLSLIEIQSLLDSKIHEHRLIGLFLLIQHYQHSSKKSELANFYLDNTRNINNWDLVDLSAPKILGEHLLNLDKKVLYQLAHSKNLWERRIAILSTFTFIRQSKFDDALKIAELLLLDHEDLIHKAVGWMLREIGKKDQAVEEQFLQQHYRTMPRTMLRYAIEKFPEQKRQFYLKKS